MRRFVLATIVVVMVLSVTATTRADNAFYRILAAKPNATFEDAVRAFFDLAVAASGDASFEGQAQTLVDMKIIRSNWRGVPGAKLTRGRVAYMICTTCGIKGGVTMRVFGPSERYAFRECVFMGVWDEGSQRDYLTGSELLGLLKWAADYIEAHPKQARPRSTVTTPATEAAPADAGRSTAPLADEPEARTVAPFVMTPATPAPATVPAGEGTRYVVQKGDTFANISIRFYGTSRYDAVIMKTNGIDDPWLIRVGQTLLIPKDPKAVK